LIVLQHAIFVLGLVLAIAPLAYTVAAIGVLLAWTRRRVPEADVLPPVTILKPLCGLEPELYDNLRTFCTQDYPDYQLVFGVRHAGDAAVPVVRRLMVEFPQLDLRLVVNDRVSGSNYKVSNLENMLPQACHPHLVLADSDIRVGPDYLRCIVGPLADPSVGVVTCLYRAQPRGSLWSRLGALFINEWFVPSVLIARAFGSSAFTFGSTIALRRQVLDDIGGFRALASHLADDYMIGALARRRGLRTVLSPYVVETVVNEPGPGVLLAHELRWARTIRVVQPWGYAGLWITHAVAAAIIGSALIHSLPWSVVLPLAAIGLRLVLHYAARTSLQLSGPAVAWLVPFRDMLSFVIWFGSFLGRRVTWRERKLAVQLGGLMQVDKESLR
jgi:ceramide glucosyltransferase